MSQSADPQYSGAQIDATLLEDVPYAASVAFAARCARRVSHLFRTDKDDAREFMNALVERVEWTAANPLWNETELVASYLEDSQQYANDGVDDVAKDAG